MMNYDRHTMIDLFLAANGKDITDVKSIPSESMDSDHRLVILQNNTAEDKNESEGKENQHCKRINIQILTQIYVWENLCSRIFKKV